LPDGFRPQHLAWRANRRRVAAAERNGLSVMRLHGTLDLLHNFEDFADLIGLKVEKRGGGLSRVFPIEETTVGELLARLRRVLKLDHVRMVGDLNRRVRCVGLPMGGLCLDSNISYMQHCVELGADVLIGGEADEYGFTFAADADIPLIETGHFVSETPGILNFVKRLQRDFPALKAVGYDDRRPFEYR
jgi:putative NIF3 family GTP cyclohydrolase 1 type 2